MDLILNLNNIQMTLVEKYRAAAKDYAAQWDVQDEHAINIAASILMTRDRVLRGGSFVQAVVDNNLNEAVGRADNTCINYLRFFVGIKNSIPPIND
jgi:capsid protein